MFYFAHFTEGGALEKISKAPPIQVLLLYRIDRSFTIRYRLFYQIMFSF